MAKRSTWDRFWSKVLVGGPGCWEWQATRSKEGYGHFRLNGRQGPVVGAHRHAFALLRSTPAQCVLHRCDNPACVRPSHLFEGSRAENNADRDAKGRWGGGNQKGSANPRAKLSDAGVRAIRERLEAGDTCRAIAADFGVTPVTIGDIARGRRWRHVSGYKPKTAHGNARLARSQVLEIRRRVKHTPGAELAREFGVSQSTISLIKLRINWAHLEDE